MGSVILLVITVALFGALFILVEGSPKPAPGVAADLQASMVRTGPTTVDVLVDHVGGENLAQGAAVIVIQVNSTSLTYNISQGTGGAQALSVGGHWRATVALPVTVDTRVVVTIISIADNRVLYNVELQSGVSTGTTGHPPIITIAYVEGLNGSSHVTGGGAGTFRIIAAVIDEDQNLDPLTGVWANLTVVPAGPQLQATSIGAGHYNLTRTREGRYETPLLYAAASLPAGDYWVFVNAQDNAGGQANYRLLLTIDAVGGTGGPTLSVNGTSVAPIAVNTTSADVAVLRLDLGSSGADTSVSQIIVAKGGTLADDQVAMAVWVDANGDGVFSNITDVQVAPQAGFVDGTANIFAVPLTTVPSGANRTLFVVMTMINAADGTNVTFSLGDPSAVRGTGLPGGLPANTTGNFAIVSTDIVVGSKFSIEPVSGAPDRMLVGAKNVRFQEFTVRSAGEPFNVKRFNVTLLGNIPRSSASAYVKINGSMISAAQNFDSSRVAHFTVTFLVPDSAGWVPMEVFLNISGSSGQTIGASVAVSSDTASQGTISNRWRVWQSSQPFPLASAVIALTNTGNLSIDEWNDTSISTSVRAGANNIYLHTLQFRAHGENIDFNKLEFVQTGNLTDAQFVAITVRVRGGTWLTGTLFTGKVTWDAGVTGKLFAITINATNSGVALADVYVNLSTSVQAKEFSLYINDNTKVRGYGKVSLSTVNANAENAPYPISLGVRRIQGDILMWKTILAPSTFLAPVNLVPILKVTMKAIGENMTLEELFLRSLQGLPASGGLTVHLYRDQNNDTTTTLQGDDVEQAPGDAGPFDSDGVRAFAPAAYVNVGTDANFVFVIDLTTAATGFSVETRMNSSNASVRGNYSGTLVPPNSQNGITNPPITLTQTPPSLVYDRGTLAVSGQNINPESQVHQATITYMLRIALTATVEAASVTSIKVHQNGNAPGGHVSVSLWRDLNQNDLVDGADTLFSVQTFASGDVTWSGSPLLTVSAGTTERLIVRVNVDTGYLGSTVGVEVSAASFVAATGATSGLGLSPSGTFPVSATTVSVVA